MTHQPLFERFPAASPFLHAQNEIAQGLAFRSHFSTDRDLIDQIRHINRKPGVMNCLEKRVPSNLIEDSSEIRRHSFDDMNVVLCYSHIERDWNSQFSANSKGRFVPILQSCLAAVPPLLFLLFGLVPAGIANRHVRLMRSSASAASALAFLLAVTTAGMLLRSGPVDVPLYSLTWPIKMSLGVYLDSLSSIMLLLITFIGAIIIRYSISYLDRDATQGRFLKWIALTLGTVLLLVVSRNLVMFTVAWMVTSFGLHQLLTHYSDRSWAVWAARKKFLISRLGDVMLLAALGLTYFCLGSVEYSEHSLLRSAYRGPFTLQGSCISELRQCAGCGCRPANKQRPNQFGTTESADAAGCIVDGTCDLCCDCLGIDGRLSFEARGYDLRSGPYDCTDSTAVAGVFVGLNSPCRMGNTSRRCRQLWVLRCVSADRLYSGLVGFSPESHIRNAARSYTNCTSGYRFCRLPSTGSVEFTCGK